MYGVSAVLVLFNMVVAAVLRRRAVAGARRNLPALATLTLLARRAARRSGAGASRQLDARPAAGHLRVGLAQGNVEQDQKWDPAFQDETMRALPASSRSRPRRRAPGLDRLAGDGRAVLLPGAGPAPRRDARRWRARPACRSSSAAPRSGSTATATPRAAEPRLSRRRRRPRASAPTTRCSSCPSASTFPFAGVLFFVSQLVTAVGQLGRRDRADRIPEPRGPLRRAHLLRGHLPGAHAAVRGRRRATSWSTSRTTPGTATPRLPTSTWPRRRSAPWRTACRWCGRRTPASAPSSTPTASIRWQGPLFEMLWHVDEIRWTGVRTFYTRYGDVFVWLCVVVTVAAIVLGVGRRGAGARPISARAP